MPKKSIAEDPYQPLHLYYSSRVNEARDERTRMLHNAFNAQGKEIPYSYFPMNSRNFYQLGDGTVVEITRISLEPLAPEEIARIGLEYLGQGVLHHREDIVPNLRVASPDHY